MTEDEGGEAATVETTNTPAAEPGVSSQGSDVETRAREQGWVPKDEWTGKPENWKPAETYLEHGDLRAQVKKLEDRLSRVGKTTEKAIATIKANAEKEIAALKNQRAAVVEKGGKDAVKTVEAIDEKIDELKDEVAEKTSGDTEPDSDEASAVADWQLDNPWFRPEDPSDEMTKYAVAYAEGLPKGTSAAEIRRKVDAKMRAKFPDYDWSAKPAPKTKASANGHALVDGGGDFDGVRSGNGKEWSDIPQADRTVADGLIAAGAYPGKTGAEARKAYAKEYWK